MLNAHNSTGNSRLVRKHPLLHCRRAGEHVGVSSILLCDFDYEMTADTLHWHISLPFVLGDAATLDSIGWFEAPLVLPGLSQGSQDSRCAVCPLGAERHVDVARLLGCYVPVA